MFTAKQQLDIMEKMKEREYTLRYRAMSENEVQALIFESNPAECRGRKEPTVVVEVFSKDDCINFKFSYMVPKSINVLQSPDCSAFLDDDHFSLLENKIFQQARVLGRNKDFF